MPHPDFTPDEVHLIASYRAPLGLLGFGRGAIGYLLSSSIVFGYGVYLELVPLLWLGFVVVIASRFLEVAYERKWAETLSSVLTKYDVAVTLSDLAPATPPMLRPPETASATAIQSARGR